MGKATIDLPTGGVPFDAKMYEQICFACGTQNQSGLNMRFSRLSDETVECIYTPMEVHQGFPDVIHGGILSTLIDEAMAWALWSKEQVLGVTATLEIKYRASVPVGEKLRILAKADEKRGRRVNLTASISLENGKTLVESSALYLILPAAQQKLLQARLNWHPH